MSGVLIPNAPSNQTPATAAYPTDIILADQLNPDGVTYSTKGVPAVLIASMLAGFLQVGVVLLVGAGAPASDLGNNGDLYIDRSVWNIYGPKAEGVWGSGSSLSGAPGASGSAILSGPDAPTEQQGSNGDFYFQPVGTSAAYFYGPKTGGLWQAPVGLTSATGVDASIAVETEAREAAVAGVQTQLNAVAVTANAAQPMIAGAAGDFMIPPGATGGAPGVGTVGGYLQRTGNVLSGKVGPAAGQLMDAGAGYAAIAAAQATANAAIPSSTLGEALGPVQADAGNKIPLSYLPASLLGASHYIGTWNPATNTPALASSTPPATPIPTGAFFIASVAGTTTLDGISNWNANDFAIFNGSIWQHAEGQSPVQSVAGGQGTITTAFLANQLAGSTALSSSGGQLNVVLGTAANTAAAGNDNRITGALQGANNLDDVANPVAALGNLGGIPAALFNQAGGPPKIDTNDNISGQTFAQNLSAFPTIASLIAYVPPAGQVFANKQRFNVTNFAVDGDGSGGTFTVNSASGVVPDQYINICPALLLGNATAGTLFSGDGATVTFSFTLPTATIAGGPAPLVPQSPHCPTPLAISCGGIVATDQGDGTLAGAGIVSGSVNYLLCTGSITFAAAPAAGAPATSNTYSYATSPLRIKRQYRGNKVWAEWFGYQVGDTTADIGLLPKLVPQYHELWFWPGEYTQVTAPSPKAIATLQVRGISTVFVGKTLPTNAIAWDWSWPTNLITGTDNNGHAFNDTARVGLSPIEGVTFIGPSATTGTSIGIRIGNTTSPYFAKPRNFAVQGFATGYALVASGTTSSFNIGGENLVLKGNGTNLVVNFGGSGNSGENVRFINCMIDNAYVAGFNVTSALVIFEGSSIDYNNVQGIANSATVTFDSACHLETRTDVGYPNTPTSNGYGGACFVGYNSLFQFLKGTKWVLATLAANGPITYPLILLDSSSNLNSDLTWVWNSTQAVLDVPLCAGGSAIGTVLNNLGVASPYNGLSYAPMLSPAQDRGMGYLMPVTCLGAFQTDTAFIRVTSPVYSRGGVTDQNGIQAPASGGASNTLSGTFAWGPGKVFNCIYYETVQNQPLVSLNVSITFRTYSGSYINQLSFPVSTALSGGTASVPVWVRRYFAVQAPAGTAQVEIQFLANTASSPAGATYQFQRFSAY